MLFTMHHIWPNCRSCGWRT